MQTDSPRSPRGTRVNDAVFALRRRRARCVGGAFTTLGHDPQNRVGAVDSAAATGSTGNWCRRDVRSLALAGSTLYAGGDFGGLDGQSRAFLGAVNGPTASPRASHPGPMAYALSASDDGASEAAGFVRFDRRGRARRVASIDTATAADGAWTPPERSASRALAVRMAASRRRHLHRRRRRPADEPGRPGRDGSAPGTRSPMATSTRSRPLLTIYAEVPSSRRRHEPAEARRDRRGDGRRNWLPREREQPRTAATAATCCTSAVSSRSSAAGPHLGGGGA